MAAADDFPRGLVLSSGTISGGATAEVAFPGGSNIAWVLTSIDAQLFLEAAGNFAYVVQDTYGLIQGVVMVSVTAADPTDWDISSWSWSGQIVYPPGAVAVGFNGPSSNVMGETLIVSGYPISTT